MIMRKLFFALISLFGISCESISSSTVLEVSPNTVFTFTAESSEATFTIVCEDDWMISGTNEWCSVSPTHGKGEDTVTLSVVQNRHNTDRSVMLVIGCGSDIVPIYVYQEAENQSLIQHPQAVDLGLSVKWASCNLGADSPEKSGNFYAWGETSPKGSYYINTYPYWLDANNDELYDDEEMLLDFDISGTVYDAASANLGGKWRMPTREEVGELCYDCKWKWSSINGIEGMSVTGPNGNSIFLPSAGNYVVTTHYTGNFGLYWSSTPQYGFYIYCLDFSPTRHIWMARSAIEGLPIRPVHD